MENSSNSPTKTEKEERSPIDNELAKNIYEKLENLEPPLSPNCCIYRVPSRLRRVNEDAYTPEVISIGPIHHGDKKLHMMEKQKLRYLRKFLERTKIRLESFLEAIKLREETIRSCYGENIHLGSDEFVQIILVDSSFIILLFLRKYSQNWQDENDRILYKPWLQAEVERDLMLLENQLPFFVLKDLYGLAFAAYANNYPPFLELAFHFFRNYNNQDRSPHAEPKHFTDMLRSFQLPWSHRAPANDDKMIYIRSATELDSAGVKFKASSSKSLLDLQFTNEVLEIPSFHIGDRTESFIRNLMALEQCEYPYNTFISDCIFLLDCLINTDKDVDLLTEKKILVNGLGNSDAMATLVNNLCKCITFYDGYFFYSDMSKQLNNYFDVLWHSWNATFMRDYFGNPWVAASTIAAVVLLVLTLIQTVASVLQLYPELQRL